MVQFNLPFEIGSKRKYKIVSDDIIMLTNRGKEAAEGDAYSGGRALVLLTINDRGSISLKELATETRQPLARIKDIVENLMSHAQVRKVSYEG